MARAASACHDFAGSIFREAGDRVARGKLEFHLPGLVIGVDDIELTGLSRRFGHGRPSPEVPYLITGRASGLALDATEQHHQGHRVATCSPHALPHQLWYLRPSRVKDEATIISAASGLAMDATRETSGDIHPVMWEPNGEPWQRWRIEPAPDKIGFRIKSPHNGNLLTLTEEARLHLDNPWAPWFASPVGELQPAVDLLPAHGRYLTELPRRPSAQSPSSPPLDSPHRRKDFTEQSALTSAESSRYHNRQQRHLTALG
jgi:hypothetical protein